MRIRARFSKVGKIRWTSHRDLARMWERAFRRVDLPLAYTSGFSPRPKVSFGLALPTGYESVAEYLDIEIDPSRAADVDVAELSGILSAALPAGVDVTAAALIGDRAPSLQHEVTSCDWRVEIASPAGVPVDDLIARALQAEQLVITRHRKGEAVEEDVRPAILSVEVLEAASAGGPWLVTAELASQPRALRPSDLLAALDPSLRELSTRRLTQWISRSDGAREEPLPIDALAAAPPDQHMERV